MHGETNLTSEVDNTQWSNSWPTFNWIQESAPFKEHFRSWNWSYQEIRTASIMVIFYKTLYKITWVMLSSKCQTQASCSLDKSWIIERQDRNLMSRGLISYRRLVGSCSKMALDGSIIVEICDERMAKMWRKLVEMHSFIACMLFFVGFFSGT